MSFESISTEIPQIRKNTENKSSQKNTFKERKVSEKDQILSKIAQTSEKDLAKFDPKIPFEIIQMDILQSKIDEESKSLPKNILKERKFDEMLKIFKMVQNKQFDPKLSENINIDGMENRLIWLLIAVGFLLLFLSMLPLGVYGSKIFSYSIPRVISVNLNYMTSKYHLNRNILFISNKSEVWDFSINENKIKMVMKLPRKDRKYFMVTDHSNHIHFLRNDLKSNVIEYHPEINQLGYRDIPKSQNTFNNDKDIIFTHGVTLGNIFLIFGGMYHAENQLLTNTLLINAYGMNFYTEH